MSRSRSARQQAFQSIPLRRKRRDCGDHVGDTGFELARVLCLQCQSHLVHRPVEALDLVGTIIGPIGLCLKQREARQRPAATRDEVKIVVVERIRQPAGGVGLMLPKLPGIDVMANAVDFFAVVRHGLGEHDTIIAGRGVPGERANGGGGAILEEHDEVS